MAKNSTPKARRNIFNRCCFVSFYKQFAWNSPCRQLFTESSVPDRGYAHAPFSLKRAFDFLLVCVGFLLSFVLEAMDFIIDNAPKNPNSVSFHVRKGKVRRRADGKKGIFLCDRCDNDVILMDDSCTVVQFKLSGEQRYYIFCVNCRAERPWRPECWVCEKRFCGNSGIYPAMTACSTKSTMRITTAVCSTVCADTHKTEMKLDMKKTLGNPNIIELCERCKTTLGSSVTKCRHCKFTTYCSEKCAKLDVESHKKKCKELLAINRGDHNPYPVVVRKPIRCGMCGAQQKNMRVCSRCKKVRYCGYLCQRGDWVTHKKACKPKDK